ncbi:MAG: signal recognition particle receptor subunit alpha, partial [Lachnospiraceae bacterium]|nr:signal recognition particle receptor subunit alpha [Lachnospiraceae bacterium]
MEEESKIGFFGRLKAGLTKTRNSFVKNLNNAFTASEIDDDFYEELEEILIMADIGVTATENIIADLKTRVKKEHLKKTEECREILKESIKQQMAVGETEYKFETEKAVIMVIGVNGVGKTTTVGKLASKFKAEGKKVLIAAADTFRAAAGEQLEVWAKRADVGIVGSVNGADPASVVFDAVSACKARGIDILLIDTAGRLHNKKNLM